MAVSFPTFSKEQQLAFDHYLSGKNVFLTGPGGTGKSKWIQSVYEHASQEHKKIQVCAMTGCAAILLHCKANTLHSWAGIGLGVDAKPLNKYAIDRWKKVQILIVDEVSMLSLSLFERLNELGQTIRKSKRPFGGIQLLFCGDFYQLPPVNESFCFESPLWKPMFHCVQLIQNFRQQDDAFHAILSELRKGKISKKSYTILKERVGLPCPSNITQLVSTRLKADAINTHFYSTLDGAENVYKIEQQEDLDMTEPEQKIRASFTSPQITYELNHLQKNIQCLHSIALKVGTLVMCTVNMKNTPICNGSQGVVTGFSKDTYPIVQFKHTTIEITPHTWKSEHIPGVGVSQLPLIYAWAMTIHKSQGSTLTSALIDVGDSIFECGQIYVALSRVTSLEGLFMTEFNPEKIKINKKVHDFYNI
jgi:ATP-dependent DNA helicase PIF1|uniref:DNA helicase Pif1-like DEAD-box helicase domain-containing protein n=1 Tax=viral metagenome TaxID=1070528 RepID=A0A6C0BAF2_9ZZZZ